MNRKKLTRFERLWWRQQRSETELTRTRTNAKNFDYVVNPPEIPRVAFGSSQERDVMPLHGPQLPNIMRKTLQEYREYPGPMDYSPEKMWNLSKDFPSKFGFSAFCSRTPRLPPTVLSTFPPIGTYDVEPKKPLKQDARPFGKHEKREGKEFLTPAPNTYLYHIPLTQYKLSTAFNTRRTYWPAVAVFCRPINIAQCIFCEETPIGDYWHNFDTGVDICRTCMRKKKAVIRSCSTKPNQRRLLVREIAGFVPARYCGFYHNHNGVNAAIPLMSKKLLRFKIRKENYLYKYID